METSAAQQAAYNNAFWCNTVCSAHQNPGVFEPDIWFTTRPAPRFYPNAVTLTQSANQHIDVVKQLIDSGTLEQFAVKDSFLALDLTPYGFHSLFEAQWIWLDANAAIPATTAGLHWSTVQSPAELLHWELFWDGKRADETIEPSERIFLPSLLDDPNVSFITGYDGRVLVAGAIVNRSGDVVGLSNQFAPDDIVMDCWAASIRTIRSTYPGLAVVGYEGGEDLDFAIQFGFQAVGPLQVWAR